MTLTSMAWQGLARRPLRSLLTGLGVCVAVGGFLALNGLAGGVARAWDKTLAQRGGHLVAMRSNSVEVLSTHIPETVVAELRTDASVADSAGELVHLAILDTGDTAMVSGWAEGSFLWASVTLASGRLPGPGEVVVGQELAEQQGYVLGGQIELEGQGRTVVGISRSSGALLGRVVLIRLDDMQALWHRQGLVTFLHVRLRHPTDPREVAATLARLQARFPSVRFSESERASEDNRVLRLLRAMNRGTSMVALGMALIVLVNTFLLSVLERATEIAVLSALGWPRARVLALIVAEGLALSTAGGLAGNLVGVGVLRWLSTETTLRSFVEPGIGWGLVLQSSVAAALLGVLGTLYPAWTAVRVPPAEVLRAQ